MKPASVAIGEMLPTKEDAREEDLLPEIKLATLPYLDPPPRKFYVEGIVPAGALTLLGAHGGAGKSILSLALAAHLSIGAAWAGLTVEKTRTWYLSMEDSQDEVLRRLKAICSAYAIPLAEVVKSLHVLDGSRSGALCYVKSEAGDQVLLDTQAMDALRRMVRVRAQVLFVDNASEAFDGNENERRHVRSFVRRLAGLLDEDGAVVLLAHVSKDSVRTASRESYSGSTAWHNSARSRVALIGRDDGCVVMEHAKSNYGRRIEPRFFRWTPEGVLIPDTSLQEEARLRQDGGSKHDELAVLAAITEANRRGLNVTTATGGRRPCAAVLGERPGLGELLPADLARNRKRINSALIRLEHQGTIQRAQGRKADRKSIEVWWAAANAANAANDGLAALTALTTPSCSECGKFAAGGMGDLPHAFAADAEHADSPAP